MYFVLFFAEIWQLLCTYSMSLPLNLLQSVNIFTALLYRETEGKCQSLIYSDLYSFFHSGFVKVICSNNFSNGSQRKTQDIHFHFIHFTVHRKRIVDRLKITVDLYSLHTNRKEGKPTQKCHEYSCFTMNRGK